MLEYMPALDICDTLRVAAGAGSGEAPAGAVLCGFMLFSSGFLLFSAKTDEFST